MISKLTSPPALVTSAATSDGTKPACSKNGCTLVAPAASNDAYFVGSGGASFSSSSAFTSSASSTTSSTTGLTTSSAGAASSGLPFSSKLLSSCQFSLGEGDYFATEISEHQMFSLPVP
jgi:hypothetical protein